MPRKAVNNPRQLRKKSCGCKLCVARFRPGQEPTRKDCSGSWEARYRNPAGKQRSKCWPTKKKAEAFLDEVRSNVRSGGYADPARGKMKTSAWYEKWLPTRRTEETTGERNESVWSNHVEPHFGDWPLSSIEHLDVEAWIARLARVTGVATIIKAYRLLDGLLAAAVRDKRIAHNPCDGVRLPKAAPKHPDDLMPPTYDQLADVRSHIPDFYHPMLIVAEETGLRWGELVGLRRCWVDFDAKTIQVREVIIEIHGRMKRKRYPKTSAGCRSVPLTDRAAAAMKAHLAAHPAKASHSTPASGMHAEELIFRGPKAGNVPKSGRLKGVEFEGVMNRNNFRRLWIPAIKEAGIARQVKNEVTGRMEWWPHVHDIRHALASRLHDLGVSEADAQKILGHERGGKITWLYVHAKADAVESVRQALEPGLRVVS